MADYAIGDVQGCFDTLQRLLSLIAYNKYKDRLWFVGDLVNRGPDSLAVLNFIRRLPITPRITLGNHDLHLLAVIFGQKNVNAEDTICDVLAAPDRENIGHWLRRQPVLIHDEKLNVVMCHAGIAPCWSLEQAKTYAAELEQVLSGTEYIEFLAQMYGNEPGELLHNLPKMVKSRVICNYFTRMRFCDASGALELSYKGKVSNARVGLYPWFAVPNRIEIKPDIVFGHWAALQGMCPRSRIHAIDSGCVWGGKLTALRLQDKKLFSC